jgi:type III secretory pathway lipoprotein EscJ
MQELLSVLDEAEKNQLVALLTRLSDAAKKKL